MKDLRYIGLILLLFTFSGAIMAQAYGTTSKKAVKRLEQALECYRALDEECAEKMLLKAIQADQNFVEAYQLLAQIYFDQGSLEAAIRYFSTSLEIDPEGNPDGYRLLADLTIMTGDYDRTLELIEQFLSFPPEQVGSRVEGELLKEHCLFAKEALKHPVPFKPENLGPAVNSEYSEYWPSLSVDETMLIFTVLLPVNPNPGDSRPQLQEDFFYSVWNGNQWDERINAGVPLNTPDNEGANTVTADGRTLFFTACNRRDGKGMCDIYQSTLEDGRWSRPVNLGAPLNSGYSEKHPTVSPDGRALYFSSNRPGGKGSYDIWVSQKSPDGWSAPVNLGDSVNTPGLEQSPFIHPDQQSLYFSSTGWPGMGQGDLFISRLKPDFTWSTPRNLGYPINTYSDEIGLSVNAKGDRAYFASDRQSGKDTDLYTFELPQNVRPVLVSYMKGRVYDSNNMKGLKAVIQLIDIETEAAILELESHEGEGDYMVSLPTGRDYALNVSAVGYLFHSVHFTFSGIHERLDPLRRDIPLDRIMVGSRVVLNNVFFNTDSYQLLPSSRAELKKVIDFLRLHPAIKVEIGGYTDNTGSRAYNQKLSDQRARAVVDYLVENGISLEKLKPVGYADRNPVSDNGTEAGRALNRRTELKIIQIGSNSSE